jgi:hypothetical protein
MKQVHECVALAAHEIHEVAGGMGDGYCGNSFPIYFGRQPKPDPQPWSLIAVSALGNVVSPAAGGLAAGQGALVIG